MTPEEETEWKKAIIGKTIRGSWWPDTCKSKVVINYSGNPSLSGTHAGSELEVYNGFELDPITGDHWILCDSRGVPLPVQPTNKEFLENHKCFSPDQYIIQESLETTENHKIPCDCKGSIWDGCKNKAEHY